MSDETQSPWPDIGNQLDEKYKDQYLFHQPFEDDNFMKLLIPPETYIDRNGDSQNTDEVFFGVKSLNIFVAQKLYGWSNDDPSSRTFDWDDPDSDYSKNFQTALDRWEVMRPRFASYKCFIWVDMYTANKVKEKFPGTKYPEMLQRTADKISDVFSDIEGFEYMGTLTDLPQDSFFYDKIDEFFGKPAYRK